MEAAAIKLKKGCFNYLKNKMSEPCDWFRDKPLLFYKLACITAEEQKEKEKDDIWAQIVHDIPKLSDSVINYQKKDGSPEVSLCLLFFNLSILHYSQYKLKQTN